MVPLAGALYYLPPAAPIDKCRHGLRNDYEI